MCFEYLPNDTQPQWRHSSTFIRPCCHLPFRASLIPLPFDERHRRRSRRCYTPDFRESPRFERLPAEGQPSSPAASPALRYAKKGFSLRLAAVFSCITRQSVNIVCSQSYQALSLFVADCCRKVETL
jgi:hypothetical protein